MNFNLLYSIITNLDYGKRRKTWGSFQVTRDEEKFKTKIIEVNPGGRLSKQYHQHRAETWVIAEGVAVFGEYEKFKIW